ncbi:hypothetical protein DTO166G4_4314 [Paecilomyces variotii]|nr:hypothetical protein DTO166G4_4314 [Paecilomyces variotii]KAJ9241979.1 hypothetical protein DTO166G5_1055 [Paecilomyces variotii]
MIPTNVIVPLLMRCPNLNTHTYINNPQRHSVSSAHEIKDDSTTRIRGGVENSKTRFSSKFGLYENS